MTTHVTAIYENGVLRPTMALPLKDGDRVEFTVELPHAGSVPDEVLERIRNAKTFDEMDRRGGRRRRAGTGRG